MSLKDVQQESLSVQQVAAMHSLSAMTVLRMIRRGELRAVKFGRQYRIPVAEMQRYLAQASTGVQEAT